MIVYLINVAFLFVWGYIFLTPKKRLGAGNSEKYFCIIAAIQWIFLSGFRGMSIGPDTESYLIRFEDVKYRSWSSLWSDFYLGVFQDERIKDPGYSLLEKIFQIFSDNYQIWLIFIAIVFTVPLAIWIYKRSSNVLISFLIYSCFFYSFFAITGHRQTIATGLVVFIGDFLIKRRKFISFLLITLIMSTVHKSCLVAIPFYFLYNKKITLQYIAVMIGVAGLAFVYKEQFTLFLAESSGYEGYGVYEGAGTYTFTTLMIMITIAALWRKKYIIATRPESVSFYNALLLSVVFIPTTFVNPSAMRIVQYFSVYIMVMIPEILNSFEKKEKVVATTVAVSVLILLFIRNNPQYVFFWQ